MNAHTHTCRLIQCKRQRREARKKDGPDDVPWLRHSDMKHRPVRCTLRDTWTKNEIKIQKTLVTTPSAILYPPTKNSRAAGRLNGNKTGGRGRAGKLRTTGHHSHDTATQCKRLMKKPANKWGDKKSRKWTKVFPSHSPTPSRNKVKSIDLNASNFRVPPRSDMGTWGSKLPTEL